MKLVEQTVFYLFLFFLPTQLGKHFWPDFSIIAGLRIDYLSPTVYLTDILALLLLLCYVVQLFNSPNFRRQMSTFPQRVNNRAVLLCIALAVLLVCNVLLSGRALGGLYSVMKLLEFLFIFFYCSQHLKTWKALKPTLLILACGIIGESLLAIVQFISQGSLGGIMWFFGERTFTGQTPGIANASIDGELLLRPYATFSHPNVLAGYLVMIMTLLFFCWHRFSQDRERIITGTALLLGTCALLLTLSRIAIVIWLILLLGTASIVFLKHHFVSRKHAALLVGMALLVGIGIVTTPVLQRLATTSLTEESVTERKMLLIAAGQMVMDHPLLGVGLGNFLPTLIQQQALTSHSVVQPVHSLVFLIAAEVGLIGLLVVCFTLAKIYSRISNCRPLLVLLTLPLLLGLFDHYWVTIQQGQLLLAFLLGLCWAKPLCDPK